MKMLSDIGEIEREATSYDVISFDIFDTLLFRNVPEPTDVFVFAEEIARSKGIEGEGFVIKRVDAEKRAGAKKFAGQDTTLDDIYDELRIDEESKAALRQAELDAERQLLVANAPMVALASRLKELGKTVVATSDMYLPADFLVNVLSERGFLPDRLYVSSDVGLRKSHGKLFGYVLEDLGVGADRVVHIGDNRLSDGLMPGRSGIASIWYRPTALDSVAGSPQRAGELVVCALAARHTADPRDTLGQIGYSYLGPLLVGMCQWIHAAHDGRPSSSLHFLSRDGYIVKKAFDILYPGASARYSYVSRRSLTVPLLTKAKSFKDVIETVPYIKREETVPALLEKLGIDDPEFVSGIEKKYGKRLSRSDMLSGALNGLFDEISGPIATNAAVERKAMEGYLSQEFSDDSMLVDIGWYGTIQSCLEKALGRKTTGLYLGLLQHNPDYMLKEAQGYVYDYRAGDRFDSALVFSFNGLVETFFSAPHGSVRKYEGRTDGSYAPVFATVEKENVNALSEIHSGALRFVEDYSSTESTFSLESIRSELAFANMERLLTEPTSDEVDLLGNLCFYDASYDRLVCFSDVLTYLRNPKALARDFLRSNWKAGWLRKALHSAILVRPAYRAMVKVRGGK